VVSVALGVPTAPIARGEAPFTLLPLALLPLLLELFWTPPFPPLWVLSLELLLGSLAVPVDVPLFPPVFELEFGSAFEPLFASVFESALPPAFEPVFESAFPPVFASELALELESESGSAVGVVLAG